MPRKPKVALTAPPYINNDEAHELADVLRTMGPPNAKNMLSSARELVGLWEKAKQESEEAHRRIALLELVLKGLVASPSLEIPPNTDPADWVWTERPNMNFAGPCAEGLVRRTLATHIRAARAVLAGPRSTKEKP